MWKVALTAICLLWSGAFSKVTYAENCMKVAYWEAGLAGEVALEMTKELYARADMCAQYLKLPLKRAESQLINHVIDANSWRSDAFINEYKNKVIALEAPFLTNSMFLVYNAERFPGVKEPSDFRGHTVAALLGDHQAQNAILEIGAEAILLPKFEIVTKMIDRGPVSALVIAEAVFRETNFLKEYRTIKLSTDNYRHVLSIRHADKVSRLEKAMKETLQAGSFYERLAKRQNGTYSRLSAE